VQERGLNFFDTAGRDPQYVDLIEMEDPFPYNRGARRGALVEAKVGRGRWMYIGLGLWRQLPHRRRLSSVGKSGQSWECAARRRPHGTLNLRPRATV
jgi:hypothetical protein